MSASSSLIRRASWQAAGPFAWSAESGSDSTDAAIPFASMSDKDCSIDQDGSLSIGACDPRFVMMCEWTSMILLRLAMKESPYVSRDGNHSYSYISLFFPSPVIHSRIYAGQFLSVMLSASQRLRKLTAS